jgi:hypothetical protein
VLIGEKIEGMSSDQEEIADFLRKRRTDKDEAKELFRDIAPSIIIQLILKGEIEKSKIHDREYILSKIRGGKLNRDTFFIVSIHDDFLEFARNAIESDNQMIAIVLVATAIEHLLNIYYRQVMLVGGISGEDITKIIRASNFEAKMGWLMSIIFKIELEQELKRKIMRVIELRNSIVHYKAVPFMLDDDIEDPTDSHSSIEDQMNKLDFDILEIPHELEGALNEQFYELNPDLKIVKYIMKTLFEKE